MAILSTLAELAEYFKGWHTKYYESLHRGLPPAGHANEKATTTKYGHVKLTDQLSVDDCYDGTNTTKDSYALCPKAGYDLKNDIDHKIDEDRERILALEKQVYVDSVKMKVGKLFPISDQELQTYIINGNLDMQMGYENRQNPIGIWGNTKAHIEAKLLPTPPERVVIKLTDSYKNPLSNDDGSIKRTTVWINMNGAWYPRRTNDEGYVFLNMKLHDPDTINKYTPGTQEYINAYRNAVLYQGDKWILMEIFANISGSYGNPENVYSSVSKKFLINFGQNLWEEAMSNDSNKRKYLHEAIGVDTYEVYRSGTPRLSGKSLENYAIKSDDGNDTTLGYNIKVIDPQPGEPRYYRYPRDSYPYGTLLSDDIYNYPKTLDGAI